MMENKSTQVQHRQIHVPNLRAWIFPFQVPQFPESSRFSTGTL